MSDLLENATAEPMPHPGVRIPPPFLFLATFLLGWLIETKVGRLPLVNDPERLRLVQSVATLVAINGVALLAWAMLTFARAKTGIIPISAATQLVDWGPYRFTRNPMYSAFTLIYAAFAWLENTGWPLLLLPLALWAIYSYVIKREERYLLGRFGAEYEGYRDRVKRWF